MKLRRGTRIRMLLVGMFLAFLLTPFTSAQVAVQPPPSEQRNRSADPIPDSPSTVQARLNRPQVPPPGAAIGNPSQFSDPVPTAAPSADGSQSKPEPSDTILDQTSQDQTGKDQTGLKRAYSSEGHDQQKTPHEPVGTAVAEPIRTTGIAAARPVGAALAPGKQRRTRSILIKVGSLVGVGVAVGTTIALSQGSPSRPPGSH
jgi:hypothetical protein